MKNRTEIIIGVVVIVLVIAGVLMYQKSGVVSQPATSESTGESGGSLYVGVTDATADIKNVNDINVTIKKVEMHSSADGWMTISSTEKNFALFSLKANGQVKLFVKKDNIPAGFYDKVR